MKSTGIVRKLDNLGRIVIPKEIRTTMDIDFHDDVEMFTDDDKIIVKKYKHGCLFCGEDKHLETFKGKTICEKCMKEIQNG